MSTGSPLPSQMGVVSFSDSGFAVQPPTNEQATILAAIDRLRPERGTSLAHGILTALNAILIDEEDSAGAGSGGRLLYSDLTPSPTPSPTPVPPGTYAPAAIVLLTDGENTAPPDPLEAVQVAADRGVRIYTIGIGSPEGATLEIEGFSTYHAAGRAHAAGGCRAHGRRLFQCRRRRRSAFDLHES